MNYKRLETVALYIRLSKEDGDVGAGGGKEESNSITNQRLLLQDYLQQHPEFQGCKVVELCDDGYSGKKFDRPQFQRLMELVRRGEVDCIVVKDLSRFGRDYIELGNYLEQLFPFLGVRFISINDHYDSQRGGGQTAGLEVAFQNFINDFYSRDTSKKMRSVRSKLAREGKFTSANAPYGYVKSSTDHHKLEIDPEAAEVVRQIFQWKLAGMSALRITQTLNAQHIPSPAQYALNHRRGMDWRRINAQTAWDPTKVVAILKDERYAGNMVSLRRTLKGIYGKDTPVERDQWVRVEHTHPGIVSYQDFLRTQDTFLVYDKGQPDTINRYNAFVCGHCGRKLSYTRDKKHLICRFGQSNPAAPCHHTSYSVEEMRGVVLQALKWHWEHFVHPPKAPLPQQELAHMQSQQLALRRSIEALDSGKTRLYEQYREGEVTREEYQDSRKQLNAQREELLEQLSHVEKALQEPRPQPQQGQQWQACLEQGLCATQLSRAWEQLFVERVTVYDREHIQICWKFQDVFAGH